MTTFFRCLSSVKCLGLLEFEEPFDVVPFGKFDATTSFLSFKWKTCLVPDLKHIGHKKMSSEEAETPKEKWYPGRKIPDC